MEEMAIALEAPGTLYCTLHSVHRFKCSSRQQPPAAAKAHPTSLVFALRDERRLADRGFFPGPHRIPFTMKEESDGH
jgi:hypothetical protein